MPIRAQPAPTSTGGPARAAARAAARGRYPKAEIVAVEPDAAWPARRAPIGRPVVGASARQRRAAVHAADADAALGRAQLVWANMVLHGIVDPPALFARWHGLLGVDGFVAFSCLGPGTLRELRELYAALGWPAPTPGFIDMHDLGDMLVAAGFAEPVLDQETLAQRPKRRSAPWPSCASSAATPRPIVFAGLRTPAWRRRLAAALAERAVPPTAGSP